MMNQQLNPLAPTFTPTADDKLKAFRDKAAAIRGELPQETPQATANGFNPLQDMSQQNDQQAHVSKMEQYLSPIKMDAFDIAKDYDDEAHANFMENLEADPAVQEYGEAFHAFLESLLNSVNQGFITVEDAQQAGKDYIRTVIRPIIKSHHGKGSLKGLHDKKEPEIPDYIKKMRGAK